MENGDDEAASYIDYETFLAEDFSPTSFANSLVTATNNASDTPLDLNTPLSRVLFDIQEIDTHIHTLTTKSALPLLQYTQEQSDASGRIVSGLEAQIDALTNGYQRLEEEVIERYEVAEEVRLAVSRLWVTVKIGRAVARCLLLGRQLEAQMAEFKQTSTATTTRKEDHRAMIRASNTLLALRELFAASGPGEEGEYITRIHIVQTIQNDLIAPSEQRLRTKTQQIVREFSLSSLASVAPAVGANATSNSTAPTPSTYAQSEETKARTTSACITLYLLSPVQSNITSADAFEPTLLLSALQTYLQTALTSSLASLARALATLPTLPRTLVEVSARCQNIVALESLLANIPPPPHPLLPPISSPDHITRQNLLVPLLQALDTSSLPSFFWRSLAAGLSGKVAEIMSRGGVSARTLRSSKDRVRDSIRDAVLKGVEGAKKEAGGGGWDREANVMVGSVVGQLGR